MERKLKEIRGIINNTIVKDIRLSENDKSKILTKIGKKHSINYKYYGSILATAIIASVLFVSTLESFSEDNADTISKNEHNQNSQMADSNTDGTVYTPPKKDENFKDMTKEEILTKMLNTVDYFETAKGEFKINYADTLGETLIEYELSLNNKAGGYSKVTYITEGAEKVTTLYYKDGTRWEIDENSGIYGEGKYSEETQGNQSETLKIEDAFSVDSRGSNVTYYRERPHIGQAGSSLFPYEIASNYTRDLNSWDIEKQNEELLGHNTLVIEGEIDRRDFQSFRFWVDKDTGILVKYETYSSDGNLVDYLHPTKLEINVPIDSEKFIPNLEGYEKLDMPGDKSKPKMITGNVDESIPEELKMQWEKAKEKPNETTTLHLDDNWYIFVEKGYIFDRIEANGDEGTLYLTKVSPQKSQFNYRAIAEGYKVDNLKIVYE
jgi:outer membrane lipoprotein-sorting protein